MGLFKKKTVTKAYDKENPKKDIFQHLEMLSYSKNCEKLLCGKIKSNRKIMSSKISSIERKKAKN